MESNGKGSVSINCWNPLNWSFLAGHIHISDTANHHLTEVIDYQASQ
jgi:hypothetical protein